MLLGILLHADDFAKFLGISVVHQTSRGGIVFPFVTEDFLPFFQPVLDKLQSSFLLLLFDVDGRDRIGVVGVVVHHLVHVISGVKYLPG